MVGKGREVWCEVGKGMEVWCEVWRGRGGKCTEHKGEEKESRGRTYIRYVCMYVRMCKLQMNNEGARGEGIETSTCTYVLH